MRTFTEIFLCLFAVYGIYSLILEICAFLSRKAHVVFAVRWQRDRRTDMDAQVSAIRDVALCARYAEPDAVILCEDEHEAQSARDMGYDIYIRYS